MIQAAVRVYKFLDEIKMQYSGKNVLIVSHGGVCRVLIFDSSTWQIFL